MSQSLVYLDHAANSPILPEVSEAMAPWLAPGAVGNPSSLHAIGRKARAALEDARDQVAQALGVTPLEVLFTSGATEANNIALYGAIAGRAKDGARPLMVASEMEHASVLAPIDVLASPEIAMAERHSLPVGAIDSDQPGVVLEEGLEQAMAQRPALATMMAVSSDVGTIQPVERMIALAGEDTWVHVDITQAIGKIPVEHLCAGATSTALSAHKMGGPVGAGVVTLGRACNPVPVMPGGGQERGVRSGTIPVALAIGAGMAVALAVERQSELHERLTRYQRMLDEALLAIGRVSIPTQRVPRSPAIISCIIANTKAETVMMALDQRGLCVSTGTACQSGAIKRSRVLHAMQVPEEHVAIRLSMGPTTYEHDITSAIAQLTDVLQGLGDA